MEVGGDVKPNIALLSAVYGYVPKIYDEKIPCLDATAMIEKRKLKLSAY